MRLLVSLTLTEMIEIYMERYAKPRKKSWVEDERRFNKYVIPALGHKKLIDITRADISNLHVNIGKTSQYQANRTRENLHRLFELSKEYGYLAEHMSNPAARISDFPEISRERFLSKEEANRLFDCLFQEHDIFIQAAFVLLLVTGLRKNELLSLKWEDVDLAEGIATIKNTKNKTTAYQPLSALAVTVLNSLPRIPGNPYVIPGGKPGGRRWDLFKPWNKIRRRAGVPDVQIHDLRRTVGSWLAQDGESLQVIGQVLNHKDIKSTLVYAKLCLTNKRKALERQSEILKKAVKLPGQKNIEQPTQTLNTLAGHKQYDQESIIPIARKVGITSRQAEVLVHFLNGLKPVYIAKELGVGRNTIAEHLRRIRVALGINRVATGASFSRYEFAHRLEERLSECNKEEEEQQQQCAKHISIEEEAIQAALNQ